MAKKARWISVYSAAHFAVDFACAFFMFSRFHQEVNWYLLMLIYNFCAFAMQMPLGLGADCIGRERIVTVIGCILTACAFGLGEWPVPAVIGLGLGNACFHVGGGWDVLKHAEGKDSMLGVFIAPGALGIYLGTLIGKKSGDMSGGFAAAVALALFVSAVLLYRLRYGGRETAAADGHRDKGRKTLCGTNLLGITCLFLTVCLRSYMGLIQNFPWKEEGYWGMILVFALVFGKAAGGVLADWAGDRRTAVCSLGLAGILYCLSGNPLAGAAAVLLFNMTMPVTLGALTRMLPKTKGFAFGTLSFALFLGYLPSYSGYGPEMPEAGVYVWICLISGLLIWNGLGKAVNAWESG